MGNFCCTDPKGERAKTPAFFETSSGVHDSSGDCPGDGELNNGTPTLPPASFNNNDGYHHSTLTQQQSENAARAAEEEKKRQLLLRLEQVRLDSIVSAAGRSMVPLRGTLGIGPQHHHHQQHHHNQQHQQHLSSDPTAYYRDIIRSTVGSFRVGGGEDGGEWGDVIKDVRGRPPPTSIVDSSEAVRVLLGLGANGEESGGDWRVEIRRSASTSSSVESGAALTATSLAVTGATGASGGGVVTGGSKVPTVPTSVLPRSLDDFLLDDIAEGFLASVLVRKEGFFRGLDPIVENLP